MKKILFGLLIALSLTGCGKPETSIKYDSQIRQVKAIKFEFEGHKYMSFEVWSSIHTSHKCATGIVHDPNCPCQNNQENE